MATPLRGLCLILLLWMTGSRPAAGVRKESLHSSPYWNQASLDLQRRAIQRRNAGDYTGAARIYQQGFDESQRLNDSLAAVKFLISVGGCQLLDFHYRDATASLLQARGIALSIGDREDAGAIAVNLANVYQQVWDFPAALKAAEDGLASAPRNSYFMPQLLLTLGRLKAANSAEDSQAYFAQSIEAARATGNVAVEALAWDLLGEQRLEAGEISSAEHALGEAFRLRVLAHSADLGYSYGLLGALDLARGDLPAADRFTALAIHAVEQSAPAWPLYRLRHQRGEIRLAQGRVEEALTDFSFAVDAVADWRTEVVPARSSLTGANVGLERQIFHSFIQAAARRAVQKRNTHWMERAFVALETNRAASLRDSLALRDTWKNKLPSQYWEILGRLGTEQARLASSTTSTSAFAEGLALELTEMEAQAGIGFKLKKDENFRTQSSLNHFRNGLGKSDLFLSFALGEPESYLWAVSRDSLRSMRIAGEKEIAAEVRAFHASVQKDGGDAAARGERLYRMLFGQLSGQELGKRTWLLSVDGTLFELPFAALVVSNGAGGAAESAVDRTAERGGQRMERSPAAGTVYLVERHSLQIVPGATLLRPPGSRTSVGGLLVAVGDPIYNSADPRWRGVSRGSTDAARWFSGWHAFSSLHLFSGWNASANTSTGGSWPRGQFPRLVGSSREVAAVAKSWRSASGTAAVLEGSDARRDAFRSLLDRHPAVIHLATHVVAGGEQDGGTLGARNRSREHSFLAFGLGTAGEDRPPAAEFLSTTEIGGLRVPGALVAMTGCDTGGGDAEAGAGLLGLSRAWLMAGARAVVATSWPVEDSGGEIFSYFYRRMPYEGAAEALRMSQVEMAHSGTWRGRPSYWASYLLVGGGR